MTTPEIDIDHLQTWIGRKEYVSDKLTSAQSSQLAAILNRPSIEFESGGDLPLGWQWIYFNPVVRSRDLDVDGHPKRGDFLPPVPLPRRMWAAGSMTSHKSLKLDVACDRRSTISDVSLKKGRSGALVFVRVQHDYWQDSQLALEEVQNIVYREMGSVSVSQNVVDPRACDWSQELTSDEVLLFRYSAVTLNAHRIHHDKAYTVNVEGYPDLIVHGPLLATFLLELAAQKTVVHRFEFRALRPLFVGQKFSLRGKQQSDKLDLWISNENNEIIMEATAHG